MLHRPLSLSFAAVLLTAAIAVPSASAEDNNKAFELSEIRAGSEPVLAGDDERFRTGWVWVDPVEDLAADAIADGHISKIIFLNRCEGGCTIQPGSNDARLNTSSIAPSTSVLSEYQGTEEQWDATVQCVRDLYSPTMLKLLPRIRAAKFFTTKPSSPVLQRKLASMETSVASRLRVAPR